MTALSNYLNALQSNLDRGNATEHTHRRALEEFIESFGNAISATNEATRIECGAPDFDVAEGKLTVGYIEVKDIGESLAAIEKGEQLKRYRKAIQNLILSDYLEFRWYVDGELRASAKIADLSKGKLKADKEGQARVLEIFEGFLAHAPEAITNPQALAERMARITHMIRDLIVGAFEKEIASNMLSGWRSAFAQVLIPDLDQPQNLNQFADMFAQTLAYGLFSARVMDESPGFSRREAQQLIPKTNPFLRDFFEQITGNALDNEPFIGFVDDLVQLLSNADMHAILAEFGADTRQEDPIFHFYESFLASYDPKLRERRGVYYTPTPVVSYIVRSVDYLLKTRFDLPNGLADTGKIEVQYEENGETKKESLPKVLILDPAVGTGTFLYEVIAHIREHYMQGDNAGMWSGFVREHLLPRLYGFELLMAPYAVAHLKLGMQLAGHDLSEAQRKKWGYDFATDDRLGIYMTNTLEEAEQQVQGLFGPMKAIAEEANAAGKVKRDLPIMVVLGNPPYSGISSNNGEWIDGLLRGRLPNGHEVGNYYRVDGQPLGEKKLWLQDDYVKFFRWAQWRIQKTGSGILAFISNSNFISGPTFRGMRNSLLNNFDEIFVFDLHGSSRFKEEQVDGLKDQNVFDIQQGVSISILVKNSSFNKEKYIVESADLVGSRLSKYQYLSENHVGTTKWTKIFPQSEHYVFKTRDVSNEEEFSGFHQVKDIFRANSSGIITSRDKLTIHWSESELKETIQAFLSHEPEVAREKFDLGPDSRNWKVRYAKGDLKAIKDINHTISKILYRPFDFRITAYTGKASGFMSWPRSEIMRHFLSGPNLGLIATRQTVDNWGVFATETLAGHKSFAAYHVNSIFPLYLYTESNVEGPQKLLLSEAEWPTSQNGRTPNLNPAFVTEFANKLKLEFVSDGKGDLKSTFGPEDIFHYAYAVFHAPTYRQRYAELLKIDFPRLPLTSDKKLFAQLAALGEELVGLHLVEAKVLAKPITRFPEKGDNVVAARHPIYLPPGEAAPGSGEILEQGRVYINVAQYFEGVPPEVWAFQIGGYQVCHKWLKDRKGRELSHADLEHYQKIVVALSETMRLMQAIDAAIPAWPIS